MCSMAGATDSWKNKENSLSSSSTLDGFMNQILVIKNFQIDIVEKLHLVKQSDCTAAKPTSSHPTSKNTRNLGNTRNWFCHNLLVDLLGRRWVTIMVLTREWCWFSKKHLQSCLHQGVQLWARNLTNIYTLKQIFIIWNKYLYFETNIYTLKQIFTIWNKYLHFETNIYNSKPILKLWNKYLHFETNSYTLKQIFTLWNKYP